MSNGLQFMLDSGWLYLALGAVLCVIVGAGAVRHLFQGAKRAEPPDPPGGATRNRNREDTKCLRQHLVDQSAGALTSISTFIRRGSPSG
jgi:hypothetical protein